MQYVFNSIALLLLGFICEGTQSGLKAMAIIFLGSTAGGVFFGSVCASELSVGSDIGYFGFTAAMLAAVIVNWQALEPIGMMRLCLVMMVVLMGMVLLLFTAPSAIRTTGQIGTFAYYDYYGHFGSFICGLFLGLMLIRRARRVGRVQESSFEKKCYLIGAGGLVLFTALMVILWLTVVVPRPMTILP
jgi:hypothetical protein